MDFHSAAGDMTAIMGELDFMLERYRSRFSRKGVASAAFGSSTFDAPGYHLAG